MFNSNSIDEFIISCENCMIEDIDIAEESSVVDMVATIGLVTTIS